VGLLPNGQVVAGSKSRVVYLLNGSSLGGIGGQKVALANACGNDIDGGLAVDGSIAYLPCLSGPIAVRVSDSPPGLRLLWSASVGGGPPIVAGGLVWTIGSNGILYGLDPTTGAVSKQASIGVPANHFPTPSIATGLLLAASANRILAFSAAGPGSTATTSTNAPPSTAAPHEPSAAPTSTGSSHSNEIVAAAVVGALVVILLGSWLLRRRRKGRASANQS
jgi:LPXTG-motif cell wall-anchored protein